MRKLPYEPYDDEDYEVMRQIIEEKDKKFRPNQSYIKTSKEITIKRPYTKLKDDGNNISE